MDQNTPHILIVEDDAVTRGLLVGYFTKEDWRVSELGNGDAVAAKVAADPPDLVLLDIRMPGKDGLTLTRELRAQSNLGIMLVTGTRTEEIDRIVGLELGADDYLCKPFNPRELVARARNLMRRVHQLPGSVVTGPDITPVHFVGRELIPARRLLRLPNGEETRLTDGEFQLLTALLRNPERILSREQLMEHVHGRDWSPLDRSIDVLLGRVRKKIQDTASPPTIIVTLRNAGYMFTAGKGR